MAGGSGERFWPLSKPGRPKQLLKLTHPDETMLEEAVKRIQPLVGDGNVYVATGRSLRQPIEESRIVPTSNVIAEPLKRNTLGALTWVAAVMLAQDSGPVTLGIVTADHKIGDPERFRKVVETAMTVAEAGGGLGTIGIVPDRPETGYGYIEVDPAPLDSNGRKYFKGRSFREKPSLATAEEFVKAGNFYWNGGMFFWTLDGFMSELEHAHPDAHTATLKMAEALRKGDEAAAEHVFEALPNLSIDYALMERAKNVFVVPSDFPWDDVGAWDALERSMEPNEQGNVIQGNVIAIDTSGCILYNEDPDAVLSVLNVEGLIVVSTPGAVLVCRKEDAQRVKEIVKQLADK